MSFFSRRNFLATASTAALASAETPSAFFKKPVIISAANGYEHLDAAYVALKNGEDTLDAAIRVVRAVEDDPNDDSVGYGGLPN